VPLDGCCIAGRVCLTAYADYFELLFFLLVDLSALFFTRPMKLKPISSFIFPLVMSSLLIASSLRLPAALVMNADFAEGKDLTLGSPATGTLTGDAVVTGGALKINNVGTSGITYGAVNNYLDVGNTTWGSNTIVTTFSLSSVSNSRQVIMGTTGDNASGIILYANHDNPNARGPRIDFHRSNTVALARLDANSRPLVNTEYFLGASWQDNNDGTLSVQLYLRQLDDLTGDDALYQTFTITNPSGNGANHGMSQSSTQLLSLGHRLSNTDPLNGSIFIFQTYNSFAKTEGEFDGLFKAVVVPEPGAVALLGAAGLLLGASRLSGRFGLNRPKAR
jgi:hypothetical protein